MYLLVLDKLISKVTRLPSQAMTLPMHLGLISWQLGRKLDWNAKREKFKGDSEANAMLHRTPRKEWQLIK